MKTYLKFCLFLLGICIQENGFMPSVYAQSNANTEATEHVDSSSEVVYTEPFESNTMKTTQKENNAWLTSKDFLLYWKDGLRLDAKDETIQLRVGGRMQHDWGFMDGDSGIDNWFGNIDHDSNLRRARVYLSGLLHDTLEFKIQYDFAGSDPDFKDLYLRALHVPFAGSVYAGHFKEPFGLDELTSSKYTTFIERNIANTFSPSRNTGVMAQRSLLDERMTWALGVFDETGRVRDSFEGGGFGITGRITGLPWQADETRFLHLGAALSYREPSNNQYREKERPETYMLPNFVDTKTIDANDVQLVGLESALVYESFSAQAEYMQSFVNSPTSGGLHFTGYYLQGSYFLTGESRTYKSGLGVFDKIKPHQNFLTDGGWGAWEAAIRFSSIDLNDKGIQGGSVDDITAGINWYWNPNTRLSWNYTHADRDDIGEEDIFQFRFQLAF